MRDIDIAKKILKEENLCLVIVKNGEVIYKSKDRGIKPLYLAVTELEKEMEGSSLADKVIGRAAAMLCEYAGVAELHTILISKSAQEVLNNGRIRYKFDVETELILNRDKTGSCPVEKLSQNITEIKLLLSKIKEFLVSINAI